MWSLSWQAAVGRDFLMFPELSLQIRQRLIGAHQRSGRVLVDFVLLPTEIHAISRVSPGDSVGGIARAFGNVVSRWVHEAQPFRGPVLAGPYGAELIESTEALRHEVCMLAWRPVFKGSCSTPIYHPHGALRVALGLTPSRGFDARPLLEQFGQTVPAARDALWQWITRRPCEQERRSWALARGLEVAAGTLGHHPSMGKAVDGAAASLIAAGGSLGIGGALQLLERWVIARICPAAPLDLHSRSDMLAVQGRALVACLAVDHRLCSAASVARYFHRAKATLSEQMAACRSRQADGQILGTPLRRIVEEAELLRAATGGRSIAAVPVQAAIQRGHGFGGASPTRLIDCERDWQSI